MKNKKKISSLILAVLMIVSMMPFNTYAEGNANESQNKTHTEEGKKESEEVGEGDSEETEEEAEKDTDKENAKIALEATIEEAKEKLKDVKASEEEDASKIEKGTKVATQKDINEFEEAIKTAEGVYKKTDATKEAFDEAKTKLNTAINNFKVIEGTKEKLTIKITSDSKIKKDGHIYLNADVKKGTEKVKNDEIKWSISDTKNFELNGSKLETTSKADVGDKVTVTAEVTIDGNSATDTQNVKVVKEEYTLKLYDTDDIYEIEIDGKTYKAENDKIKSSYDVEENDYVEITAFKYDNDNSKKDEFSYWELDGIKEKDLKKGSLTSRTIKFKMPDKRVELKAVYGEDEGDSKTPKLVKIPFGGDKEIKFTDAGEDTKITIKNNNGKVLGYATANNDGECTVKLDRALNAGETIEIVSKEPGKKETSFKQIVQGVYLDKPNVYSGKGYIKGIAPGIFGPDEKLTRAQAAVMIARLHNGSENFGTTKVTRFRDASHNWYSQAINYAVINNLINGYPDGTFRPDADITRAEFANIISGIKGGSDKKAPFNDISAHWAEVAINKVYAAGIIKGYNDGSFKPNNKVTRAEAVTMLNKAFDVKADSYPNSFKDVKVDAWYHNAVMNAAN